MEELEPGLWRWAAPHPEWKRSHPWTKEVASFALELDSGVALVDPLAPDGPPAEGFWAELDRLVERGGGEVLVFVTIPYHVRSAEALHARYGARILGHAAVARRLTGRHAARGHRAGQRASGRRAGVRDRKPAPAGAAALLPLARRARVRRRGRRRRRLASSLAGRHKRAAARLVPQAPRPDAGAAARPRGRARARHARPAGAARRRARAGAGARGRPLELPPRRRSEPADDRTGGAARPWDRSRRKRARPSQSARCRRAVGGGRPPSAGASRRAVPARSAMPARRCRSS